MIQESYMSVARLPAENHNKQILKKSVDLYRICIIGIGNNIDSHLFTAVRTKNIILDIYKKNTEGPDMRRFLKISLLVTILVVPVVFIYDSFADKKITYDSNDGVTCIVNVKYEFGIELEPTGYTNIYAVWLEDAESNFLQNIAVCQRLVNNGTTGTALPFWKLNKYPKAGPELDAVTSATQKNCNFSVSAILKDNTTRKFKVFFEIDRSFEPNDWFTDQPAVLYSADIDLDHLASSYTLQPVGWTPNENTENAISNTPKGVLQKEMRYITNHKSNDAFGSADARSLTSIVKQITATVQIVPSMKANSAAQTNENNISISFDQTISQIYITSKKTIDEIMVTDSQGKVFFQSQPKIRNVAVKLNRKSIQKGLYLVKIRTGKEVSLRKLMIKE